MAETNLTDFTFVVRAKMLLEIQSRQFLLTLYCQCASASGQDWQKRALEYQEFRRQKQSRPEQKEQQ